MGLNATELSSLRWESAASSVAEADALLAKLWSSESRHLLSEGATHPAASESGKPLAVRTGVMNLVVIAPGEERAISAAAALATLPRNPSRTLFIVPRDPEGPPTFKARLEVFCAVTPRGDGTAACTELLWIDASGEAGRHLSSIVPQLSLHDLPTLLWWDSQVDPQSRDLKELFRGVDRVMVDGSRQRGIGIDVMKSLARVTTESGVAMSDFSMIRQARWREAVASMFDEPEVAPFLQGITSVSATYAVGAGDRGPVNIVKPAYQIAWIASQMGWRISEPLQQDETGWSGAATDDTRRVALRLEPSATGERPGTTLSLQILGDRRGASLELTVRADGTTAQSRATVNGVLVKERIFHTARATDAELLSHALEFGEADPLSPKILRTFTSLVA
jgi:glucose-6-phosphate dehydrogenase assembly protein OpcA